MTLNLLLRQATTATLRGLSNCSPPRFAPIVRCFSSTPRTCIDPTPSFRRAVTERDATFGLDEKEWTFDDISSAGHDELEQHREARHYARIAAYEMPLLAQYTTPFEPPGPTQVLRFRYTTYMGDKHPAEPKVVMEFCTKDFGLSPVSRRKLIKLAGRRYNPKDDIVKISCEMFETQAQNKRYLSDLLDRILEEAKDLTDDFEDIPFDFRHYEKRFKAKPKFPVEWRMTKEKRKQLAAMRRAESKANASRVTASLNQAP